jgi:hypothetical protein
MSASVQDLAPQSAAQLNPKPSRANASPPPSWRRLWGIIRRYLSVKTAIIKLLGGDISYYEDKVAISEQSDEEILSDIADKIIGNIAAGEIDLESYLSGLHEHSLFNGKEVEFHEVMCAVQTRLMAGVSDIIEAASQGEHSRDLLDQADRYIELCDSIDVYAAIWFLGRVLGRVANRAEVHPNPGTIH